MKAKSFEESISRLEEIVSALEHGEINLEESIKLYEEGMKIAGQCAKQLDAAEQKIVRLSKGPDGSPQETPVEEEDL